MLLSGEGADEVFAGYGLYARNFQLERLRRVAFPIRSRALRRVLRPFLRTERLRKYLDWAGAPLDERHRGNSADVTPSLRPDMYHEDFQGRAGTLVEDEFARHFAAVAGP